MPPPGRRWRPGEQAAKRQSTDIENDLSFFRIALLVFAGVSLFVGAFQIFNTFSITVAQRTREFGMLRTLGASRRQMLARVGLEALTLGVLGAAAGLAGGIGFAVRASTRCSRRSGSTCRTPGTVLELRTIIVSLLVGVVRDARRRAEPGAAGHAGHADGGAARGRASGHEEARASGHRLRVPARRGRARAHAASGSSAGSTTRAPRPGLLGGGAALILFGVSLFSPRLVRPLASVAGLAARAPARAHRPAGARERDAQARSHGDHGRRADDRPRADRVRHRLRRRDQQLGRQDDRRQLPRRDRRCQNTDGFSPIPARGARRRARRGRRADRLGDHATPPASCRAAAGTSSSPAVDPATLGQVLALDFKSGDPAAFASLAPNGTVLDENFARDKGLEGGRHAAGADADRARRDRSACSAP